MSFKLFQGENIALVGMLLDDEKQPILVFDDNLVLEVLLLDSFDKPVIKWSTKTSESDIPVTISSVGILILPILQEFSATLLGGYRIEANVMQNGSKIIGESFKNIIYINESKS